MKDELDKIQNYLEMTCSEDANEAVIRGNDLAVYIARSGKMLADAKFNLDSKMSSEVMAMLIEVGKKTPYATSKAINALVDALCRDERYMINWIERINRTATHQLDWLRTLISKAKAEQMVTRGFNT